MRWPLLVLTVLTYGLCFSRHSASAMAWWLLLAVIGTFATALAFAQARIEGNSRGDSLSEYQLRRLREGKDPLTHERDRPGS